MIEEQGEEAAEGSPETDLDLVEDDEEQLPPDTSPEATAEGKLTETEGGGAELGGQPNEPVELEDENEEGDEG